MEARDVLYVLERHKNRPLELEDRSLRLAGKLLDLCYATTKEKKNGSVEARRILTEGIALEKFKEIIAAQGGNPKVSSDAMMTKAHAYKLQATQSGTIKTINNFNLNSLSKILGAPTDKYAGMYVAKRTHEAVKKGDELATLYSSSPYHLKEAIDTLTNFPIYTIE